MIVGREQIECPHRPSQPSGVGFDFAVLYVYRKLWLNSREGFVLHIILAFLLIQTAPNQSAKAHSKPAPKTAKNSTTPDIADEKPALNFQFNLPPTPEIIPQPVSWWKRPSLTDWIMVGLTFSYVIVNVLILLAIKRQAQIAADSLTEFQKQAASTENQFKEQLKVIEEQSQSTKTSADAAKVSADASVAAQRAWLEGEFKPEGWGVWNLIATNHGATPAQLLRHEYSVHLEGEEFNWESPVYKDTRNWGTLVGAGKPTEILQAVRPDDVFTTLRQMGIKGTASCTIGVVLVYTDVFNTKLEHRTRFLMFYNRVSKAIERLSQYNEYT